MKYLTLAPLAAVAAVMQALAIYAYDQDGMAVAGQIFFPVLFTLMALYLMMRNPGGSAKQLVVVVLELAVFAVTMVGVNQKNPYLYPSIIVYYASFAVLALEVAVRIAEMPKKAKAQDDSEDPESSDQDAPAEGSDDTASVKTDEKPAAKSSAATKSAGHGLRRARAQRGTHLVAKVKPREGAESSGQSSQDKTHDSTKPEPEKPSEKTSD